MHCQVSKHFSVDGDVCFFEPIHERAVGHAMSTGCCVDSHDPQFAEISFFPFAVIIRTRKGVQVRLACAAVDIFLSSPISLSDCI